MTRTINQLSRRNGPFYRTLTLVFRFDFDREILDRCIGVSQRAFIAHAKIWLLHEDGYSQISEVNYEKNIIEGRLRKLSPSDCQKIYAPGKCACRRLSTYPHSQLLIVRHRKSSLDYHSICKKKQYSSCPWRQLRLAISYGTYGQQHPRLCNLVKRKIDWCVVWPSDPACMFFPFCRVAYTVIIQSVSIICCRMKWIRLSRPTYGSDK